MTIDLTPKLAAKIKKHPELLDKLRPELEGLVNARIAVALSRERRRATKVGQQAVAIVDEVLGQPSEELTDKQVVEGLEKVWSQIDSNQSNLKRPRL